MTFNIRNTQYGTGPSEQKAPGNNLYRKANARIRRDQAWESLEQVQRQDSVTLMHDNFYLEKRRVRKWSRSIVNLWQASVREPSLLSPHHLDTLGTEPAFQSQCPKTPTGKRPSGKQPYLLTRGRGGGRKGCFPNISVPLFVYSAFFLVLCPACQKLYIFQERELSGSA